MGFRFRKSIKILPGIRLNLSRSGVSATVGAGGASVNVGPNGTFVNTSIPGTGISYREKISSDESQNEDLPTLASSPQPSNSSVAITLIGVTIIVIIAILVGLQ